MSVTQKIEALSSIKTGSEMIYKTFVDSSNASCCAGNKMIIRVSTTSAAASIPLLALIPLKPPCSYCIKVTWVSISTNNNVSTQCSIYRVDQLVSGGAISPPAGANLINSFTGVTSVLAIFKNATTDSLDIVLTVSNGGTVSHSLEFEITSARNF